MIFFSILGMHCNQIMRNQNHEQIITKRVSFLGNFITRAFCGRLLQILNVSLTYVTVMEAAMLPNENVATENETL